MTWNTWNPRPYGSSSVLPEAVIAAIFRREFQQTVIHVRYASGIKALVSLPPDAGLGLRHHQNSYSPCEADLSEKNGYP